MEWPQIPNLKGMKTFHETPIQFHTNHGIGLRLANAAARKGLCRATTGFGLITMPPHLSGDVQEDTVGLGTDALIQHARRVIHAHPLKILVEGRSRTRIRVSGALDYVIDRAEQRVWVETSPLTHRERLSKQRPPWHNPCSGPLDNVDVLNPLSRPAWLVYMAARPGWFGYAFARHEDAQSQLFVQQDEMAHALSRVADNAWREMHDDMVLVALRHQLSSTLTLHIGPGLVNLAMRARHHTHSASLTARHLNLVWRHQAAFESMERENPRLLPALTAWLLHDKTNDQARLPDALAQMRSDLLASDLPPKAWRYLAQHGMKRLLPTQLTHSPWASLLTGLGALNAARWPALPPRGFLRLLHDAAGRPDSYDTACDGVPGWFWQMTCDEAYARRGDTCAYLDLFGAVPRWAWLVREFALKPDKNQRRKGLVWLCEVAQAHEHLAKQDDVPAWASWLQSARWDEVPRVKVVPLLSPNALLQEAIALHNCVDSYTSRCQQETHLLFSLRDCRTGKRVALMCVERRGSTWMLGQVAGPCNRPVPGWVRQVAVQVAAWVRYHHSQRLSVLKQTSAEEGPTDLHILFQDP